MLNYLWWDLKTLNANQVVSVEMAKPANVKLLTYIEFSKYQRGLRHIFRGGYAITTPYRIKVPANNQWVLVVDLTEPKLSLFGSMLIKRVSVMTPTLAGSEYCVTEFKSGCAMTDKEVTAVVGEFNLLWARLERKNDNACTSEKFIKMTDEEIDKMRKEPFEYFALVMEQRAREQYGSQDEKFYIEIYVKESVFPPEAKKHHNDEQSINDYIIPFIKSQGKEKLQGAFLAIYRIKNNLTHGFKPDGLREQMPLFQAMSKVLGEATNE